VLGLGLLKDRNVGVGLLPEREEILIPRARFGSVALQGMGAAGASVSLGVTVSFREC
jgi:hypothetical protein